MREQFKSSVQRKSAGPDCAPGLEETTRRSARLRHGQAAGQERAERIRPLQNHRHAKGRTAGGSGGGAVRPWPRQRQGLAWRGSRREGGGEQREEWGEGAAEVYEELICRIGRGVFGKASLSVGTRSQQCQRQRSVGACQGYTA